MKRVRNGGSLPEIGQKEMQAIIVDIKNYPTINRCS